MDDANCFAFVRQRRWPEGIRCPVCDNGAVIRDGHDDTQPCRQRYRCKTCACRFDDLTGTVLAGHHQPLRAWVLCLYFMGLNLSNRQIALELGLDASDTQAMTEQLRERVGNQGTCGDAQRPSRRSTRSTLWPGTRGSRRRLPKGAVRDAAAGWQARQDAARLEKNKPPVLGLIQRGGQVVLRMLANVQQRTIKPIITAAVAPGALVHTDEYSISARLPAWGYRHKTVCHARGEYAHDEDGDGCHAALKLGLRHLPCKLR